VALLFTQAGPSNGSPWTAPQLQMGLLRPIKSAEITLLSSLAKITLHALAGHHPIVIITITSPSIHCPLTALLLLCTSTHFLLQSRAQGVTSKGQRTSNDPSFLLDDRDRNFPLFFCLILTT
jgi:hypothetical protein